MKKKAEPSRAKSHELAFLQQIYRYELYGFSKYLQLVQRRLEEQEQSPLTACQLDQQDLLQQQLCGVKNRRKDLVDIESAIASSKLVFSQSHQFMHDPSDADDVEGIRLFSNTILNDICGRLRSLGFVIGPGNAHPDRSRGKGQLPGGVQAREEVGQCTGRHDGWQPSGKHFAGAGSQRQLMRSEQWASFDGRASAFLKALKDNLKVQMDATRSAAPGAIPARRKSAAR